jgi:hypothetical protein
MRRHRASVARTTAAGLLWGQGLAVLIWAGLLLPRAIDRTAAVPGRPGVVATLVIRAAAGAAALLVGTGLMKSMRGARAAGLAVQAVLLASAVQSHRPVLIAVAAAVTVITGAVLLAPALALETGSAEAPGE